MARERHPQYEAALCMIAQHKTSAEISQVLGIPKNTIKRWRREQNGEQRAEAAATAPEPEQQPDPAPEVAHAPAHAHAPEAVPASELEFWESVYLRCLEQEQKYEIKKYGNVALNYQKQRVTAYEQIQRLRGVQADPQDSMSDEQLWALVLDCIEQATPEQFDQVVELVRSREPGLRVVGGQDAS